MLGVIVSARDRIAKRTEKKEPIWEWDLSATERKKKNAEKTNGNLEVVVVVVGASSMFLIVTRTSAMIERSLHKPL